ncbi:hypothetical protein NC653_037750 [Populus alba x Populus x berolinensis]|uniref:Ubiquitin-like domain-containing protein n=1 Tax=Populus alba x Populus x berolinensis TaxID=444605 RepID=A0AAD6PSJ3_9ROSI|nr:hypothetical protein NC653_037750 [Populus alba x Populus x berolinensis]
MQKKFGCHPSSLAFPHSSRSWLLAIHLSNPPVQLCDFTSLHLFMQSIECGVLSFFLFIAGWRYVRYKIKPHASLSRLMDEYIERRGMEGHSLRFFYNGKRITKRHMQPRFDLVSSQGELNCLDRDFLGPYFVLHQLLCLAGFANPFTGTLAGNGLELTESTDHLQSLRKLFKEVQAELQLNLPVNRLKKDMNNQTINECIDLQKSYTSENI